jgi:hypothetical protein
MGFSSTDFTFGVVPFGSSAPNSLAHDFESYLDEQLSESGKLSSDAAKVCASWFLARLRSLDSSIPAEASEHNDGGGYCFEIAVAAGTYVVASFQLQGDAAGVALLGRSTDAETCEQMLSQFADTLLAAPDDVSECCYRIVDPEWQMDPDCFVPTPTEDSANEYGWRDGTFLGIHNICEE